MSIASIKHELVRQMDERLAELAMLFAEAALITSMVICYWLAFTASPWWYVAAMLVAAITLWVFREVWLDYAYEPERRPLVYTFIALFLICAVITTIWSFKMLLTVIGVCIFTGVILWMMNSSNEYKRSRRY